MCEVNYYDFKLAISKVWDNPEEIDKLMMNPEIACYFEDWGGRPASNAYRSTHYRLCTCKTKFEPVHRQLDIRKCNCVKGKQYIAFNVLKEHDLLTSHVNKWEIEEYDRWIKVENIENNMDDSDIE